MSRQFRTASLVVVLGLIAGPGGVDAGSSDIFADGFEPPPDCIATPNAPGCPTFTILPPAVEIPAGTEISYCYYFRTPNQATIGVRKFQSTLGTGVADIIVYATYGQNDLPAELQSPGTLTSTGCGFAAGTIQARRVYQAHEAVESLQMPGDDGTGKPVAIELLANQPLYVLMHFANASDQPVMGSITLDAFALAPAVAYTRTATFMTYNGQLNIPSGSFSDTESATCAVPSPATFWWFSTHTHKQAIEARLRKGANTIVVTTNWENPAITTFGLPSFYTFGAGETLTYECTYLNNTGRTITTGDSRDLDENCVGIAYFFPADRPRLCFNNILLN